MKLINIGFGNMVSAGRLIAIVSPESAPIKRMVQEAKERGADGLLLVTPYYNTTSQKGLLESFNYVADSVKMPCILYNVPSRTGVSFTAETYKVLSENPRSTASRRPAATSPSWPTPGTCVPTTSTSGRATTTRWCP